MPKKDHTLQWNSWTWMVSDCPDLDCEGGPMLTVRQMAK